MADLGQGINVNNGIINCDRQMLTDLQNKAIDMSLIANTNYDVDGTTLKFIAPFNIAPTSGAKSTFNACSHNIICASASDFDVAMTQWQNDFYAFAKCAVTMLSPEALANALNSYIKGWLNNEVAYFFAQMDTAYSLFVPTVEAVNVVDITEEMIAELESNGYSREDMVVVYSNKTASAYRKLYSDCCELANSSVEVTTNKYGVSAVVNAGIKATSDIYVYVKDYALFGTYCTMLPEAWDGTDAYRGFALIGGSEGFGVGFYDNANAGLRYVLG